MIGTVGYRGIRDRYGTTPLLHTDYNVAAHPLSIIPSVIPPTHPQQTTPDDVGTVPELAGESQVVFKFGGACRSHVKSIIRLKHQIVCRFCYTHGRRHEYSRYGTTPPLRADPKLAAHPLATIPLCTPPTHP